MFQQVGPGFFGAIHRFCESAQLAERGNLVPLCKADKVGTWPVAPKRRFVQLGDQSQYLVESLYFVESDDEILPRQNRVRMAGAICSDVDRDVAPAQFRRLLAGWFMFLEVDERAIAAGG